MIFTTTRIDPSRRRTRTRAFTLSEMMIGSAIGAFVLTGVMTAFLMLGRSGMSVANYSMSESELRRAVDDFSQDVRMASNITWNSATSITLTVPGNYTNFNQQVTYAYDSGTSGNTAKCFYRTPSRSDAPAGSAGTLIYVRNVSSCTFARYNRLDHTATTDAETKRIQLTLNVQRTGVTLVASNTSLVSASFILRNKVAN